MTISKMVSSVYNTNVISKEVISYITKHSDIDIDKEEKESIEALISYHECEPMCCADRLSEMYNVDRTEIFKLL